MVPHRQISIQNVILNYIYIKCNVLDKKISKFENTILCFGFKSYSNLCLECKCNFILDHLFLFLFLSSKRYLKLISGLKHYFQLCFWYKTQFYYNFSK